MGAKVRRAVGAVGLVAGMVLVVSGGAWSAPTGLDLPGDSPASRVLERVLPAHAPGDAQPEPAHGSPGDSPSSHHSSGGEADGDSAGGDADAQHHDDHDGDARHESESGHHESSGGGDSGDDHDGDARHESESGHHESSGGGDSEAQGDSESRDAYITRTCERILGQPPTGGLDKTTDPAAGSAVAPGDEINVTITWDPSDWSGESLHKAIDCVTINGAFVLGLTVEERPTANDGTFETRYTIPVEVVAGDEICDQGFLSGDSSGGGFEQGRSNQVCFKVEGTAAPAPVTPPVTPPAQVPPQPAPAVAAAPAPTEVLGEYLVAPAPAPRAPAEVAPAGPRAPEVAGATLPRTGQETRRGPVLAAGVVLMFGGFGLIGGNRRPRRALHRPV